MICYYSRWYHVMLYCITSYYIVMYFEWYHFIFYSNTFPFLLQYIIVQYCIVLYWISLYCLTLHNITLYYIIFLVSDKNIKLCFIMLWYRLLFIYIYMSDRISENVWGKISQLECQNLCLIKCQMKQHGR